MGTDVERSALWESTPSGQEPSTDPMTEFWQAFTHPVVLVFFVPLAICLIFWAISLLGFIDLDVELDLDTDVDLDGAAEGSLGSVLDSAGVAGVPPLFVVTAISLIGWFVSMVGVMLVVDPLSGLASLLAAFGLLVVALIAGLTLGIRVSRPLSRLMQTARAPKAVELVGREALVRSGRVDAGFGYADADWPDGSQSRIDIRPADGTDAAGFGPGDTVRIVAHDAARGVYLVASDAELFGPDSNPLDTNESDGPPT